MLSVTQHFSISVELTFNIHFSTAMMRLYMWVTEPHVVIELSCGWQVTGSAAWQYCMPSERHNISIVWYHLEQRGGQLCCLTFPYALCTSQYRYIAISPWTDRWPPISPTCLQSVIHHHAVNWCRITSTLYDCPPTGPRQVKNQG